MKKRKLQTIRMLLLAAATLTPQIPSPSAAEQPQRTVCTGSRALGEIIKNVSGINAGSAIPIEVYDLAKTKGTADPLVTIELRSGWHGQYANAIVHAINQAYGKASARLAVPADYTAGRFPDGVTPIIVRAAVLNSKQCVSVPVWKGVRGPF